MSGLEIALGCVGAALLATSLLRRLAPRFGLLDVPNARSSHQRAVPRGGGLAIALPVLGIVLALTLLRRLPAAQALAWLGGGALIAAVGLLDDRGGLSVRVRLMAQLLAALAVMWVWDPAPLAGLNHLGAWLQLATWLSGTIAVVWVINLFNFMDGIDGLAAQQALFVCAAALWLGAGPPASPEGWLLFALAGSTGGFLVWNWAPARIFMGDVGSGFVGFALALAAVASSRNGSTSIWLWTILMAAFIADATVTVCVRMLRRERIHQAHRQHAYQRLSRHWGSHARVSGAFLAVDLLWLLPLALAAARRPRWAPWLALAALLALVVLALLTGAGRPGDIGARASATPRRAL